MDGTGMEISEFLTRKLERRFETFDFDGDGRIERSDFESSARAVAAEFGHEPDSPAAHQLLQLSLQLWGRLASVGDVDIDGSVDLAEYKQAFAEGLLVTEESFDQGYRPFLSAIMAIADGDGDGKLNAEDYARWTGALMHLPAGDAREIHRRLDTDGDGFVTTEDLLQAIHDYYFDENPEGVGSWLLGKLRG
ncbi:EF-hand domain-containing protein [Nocardia asteroides]|uniref:EF-hand domain-containing protein n=1 Tax=Nocardia TaxID=1817 RepID=UPI0019151C7C|nr:MULTISPECIES: EF-hand domain-containing protein [Nocardia]UAK31539.1 EF-hand domain-containing protein [Nocardia asteroides]